MSTRVSTATPARPTSPRASGWSESRPIRVGMSKAVDRPGAARPQQLLEARVRVVGRAEAGEHPHRPEARPVHRRVHAARVGVRARVGRVAVDRVDGDARHRLEGAVAERRGAVGVLPVAPGLLGALGLRHGLPNPLDVQ